MTSLHLKFISTKRGEKTCFLFLAAVVLCIARWLAAQTSAPSHELLLELDPAQSTANITLTGNFHTVEGSFQSKRGTIHYDPATGKTSGEIVFDSTSGQTGNHARDSKMHKSVIESARFPEIVFRPDHAAGTLALGGDSTLQVHGIVAIHGSDHEVIFPVTMHVAGKDWTAKANFQIPYADWGMKNPSVLFLKVADFVEVELDARGRFAP
jgi:polyisoprenoid-binding protein YceI